MQMICLRLNSTDSSLVVYSCSLRSQRAVSQVGIFMVSDCTSSDSVSLQITDVWVLQLLKL